MDAHKAALNKQNTKASSANNAPMISSTKKQAALLLNSNTTVANKRSSFSRSLPRLLHRCKSSPSNKLIRGIDHRLQAAVQHVLSSSVFQSNQLVHTLKEHCNSVLLVRVQKYEGPLGCAFSGAHTKLVSVRLSCETSKQPQTLLHHSPIVMQTHMAQLVRCICVLRTWTQLEQSTHWSSGVCRSFSTLRRAARLLQR